MARIAPGRTTTSALKASAHTKGVIDDSSDRHRGDRGRSNSGDYGAVGDHVSPRQPQPGADRLRLRRHEHHHWWRQARLATLPELSRTLARADVVRRRP